MSHARQAIMINYGKSSETERKHKPGDQARPDGSKSEQARNKWTAPTMLTFIDWRAWYWGMIVSRPKKSAVSSVCKPSPNSFLS